MKKILLSIALACCMSAAADTPVTRTVHKAAVKNDAVTQGTFSHKKGGTMSLVFSDTDKLTMEGKTYTMYAGQRKSVASGETAVMFGVLQRVMDNILTGGDGNISQADSKGAVVTREGNTVTITPDATLKANRLLFTSFVLEVDAKKHTLKSLRMNGRGKNYTLYEMAL